MKWYKHIVFFLVMTIAVWSAVTGGWDGNACSMPDLSMHVTADGVVLYNTSEAIGGFQFNVDGGTLNGSSAASGGDAGGAGFMISTNPGPGMVLGFSLTGATIGSGCGTLLELDINGTPTGLSDLIISDVIGNEIFFEYFQFQPLYPAYYFLLYKSPLLQVQNLRAFYLT